MLRIVLDSNIILAAALPKSKYRKVISDFLNEKYALLISPEIVFEYEEKLVEIFNRETADHFLQSLFNSDNLIKISPFFDFRLIKHDADDDKFANCAIVGNAHYIVSNDKHFNILKSITFPKLNVINIDEFIEILNQTQK